MKTKKFIKDKKGIFGLTSVQQFFIILLSVALIAYVIVVVMGTLTDTNILTDVSTTVIAEQGRVNGTAYPLAQSLTGVVVGYNTPTIISIVRSTGAVTLTTPANYTLTGSTITNVSGTNEEAVNISYRYLSSSRAEVQSREIVGNTSQGVMQFFSNISPVYAILAILVIILVLVVLVRVVSGGEGNIGGMGGKRAAEPIL